MIILGIDPGIATVGYGVLEYEKTKFRFLDCGIISTPPGIAVEKRLDMVYCGITALTNKYKPDTISVEELFFNTNQKTAVNVCQARGVILLAAERQKVPIFEYTPLQVKQAVVGYGRAEKRQVMEMVKIILKLDKIPRPDDAADALALAICLAHSGTSKIAKINRPVAARRTGGK